ncbi:hypothetical protein SAMN05444172_2599 [Burkholderia sp. GAS332]|nr:hypothetical protein SAMN05444172_2599 [Burkholderia sp. GAS332]
MPDQHRDLIKGLRVLAMKLDDSLPLDGADALEAANTRIAELEAVNNTRSEALKGARAIVDAAAAKIRTLRARITELEAQTGSPQHAEVPADAGTVDDLRMLVSRLARSLRLAKPDNALSEEALGYLKRKELTGSILRDDAPPVGMQGAVAYEYQHMETGRLTCIDVWQYENGWAEANPQWGYVGALYRHPLQP